MPFIAGRKSRGDIEVAFEPSTKGKGIEIELDTSVERLYGEKIRTEIADVASELGIADGKFTVVDDGALPYVLKARVEAAIRLAKEVSDER